MAIPPQFVLRIGAAFADRQVGADEQPEIGAVFVLIDQFRAVCVVDDEIPVIQAHFENFMDQRQNQRAIGARLDGDPVIGNGGVA